jgi:hypothetical protein
VFFYLTALPNEAKRQDVLTDFLKKFKNHPGIESRGEVIARAEELGLNARAAAKRVVEESRQDCRREADVDSLLGGGAGAGGRAVDPRRLFAGLKVSRRTRIKSQQPPFSFYILF